MSKSTRRKVPPRLSAYIRYLHQECGLKVCEIARQYPDMPVRTVNKHANLNVTTEVGIEDKRHRNPGKPRKLSARDDRHISNTVNYLCKTYSNNFPTKKVQDRIN